MTIGERIKKRREELEMTQEELASLLGYKSRSSINKIELGGNELTQKKIHNIATVLNTTPTFIMGWEEPTTNLPKNCSPVEFQKIPLLGEIACGEPTYANEDFGVYVQAGAPINADFCLRAKGDSMIGARILDGDLVFIKKQEMVDNGEIAAVLIGEETTLKRVHYNRDTNELLLMAENPMFPTQRYMGEELNQIRILGKAVKFLGEVR